MAGATAVTIGNFDGAHVGHAALIARARELVGGEGRVVVMGFDPHPRSRLGGGDPPGRLTSWTRRVEILRGLGADAVERLEPTDERLGQDPAAFVAEVAERHRPAVVVEGPDFRFGRGRRGDVGLLRDLGPRHGFALEVVAPVQVTLRDQTVATASSTLARWLIEQGRVRDVAYVLGRPHEIAGAVVPGDRRGRTIGVPTANVAPETMTPAVGVYAGIGVLDDGRCFAAAVNVGSRPTFDGTGVRVEAHLLDVSAEPPNAGAARAGDGPAWAPLPGLDEYGWPIRIELVGWVRDEIRFGSVDALREQLRRDCERVRAMIGPIGPTRHGHLEMVWA